MHMHQRAFLKCLPALCVGLLLLCPVVGNSQTTGPRLWTQSVLYSFRGGADGAGPLAGVIADGYRLYGTTFVGGSRQCGIVFRLTPAPGRIAWAPRQIPWAESILHDFQAASANDGCDPAAGLFADASGNLYGTTQSGGGGVDNCHASGCGTVFRLVPTADSSAWTENVLYRFPPAYGGQGSNCCGWLPSAGLIGDRNGDLYGTTQYGGYTGFEGGWGVVFELLPLVPGTGQYAYDAPYEFSGNVYDDGDLKAALVLDGSGNLYGTTAGADSPGTVFELARLAGNAGWSKSTVHAFTGTPDGATPLGGLILDDRGSLYGTTAGGGAHGFGSVFALARTTAGWTEHVLHSFTGTDGSGPDGSLVADPNGNLYGTTAAGGPNNKGVVFALSPPIAGGATWTEQVMHAFSGLADGGVPHGALLLKNNGLYGATQYGGAYGQGTVFEVTCAQALFGLRLPDCRPNSTLPPILHSSGGTSDRAGRG